MFGLAQHEKYTYQHYLLLPEGDRRELIEGELLMTPAPNEKHQRAVRNLGTDLHLYLEQSSLGTVYFAPFDVILDDHNVVQPDLLIVLQPRLNQIHPEGLRGAPDIVVEVLSPATSSRDRIYKRFQYFRFGVQEYWIVDPTNDSLEQYRRGAEDFEGERVDELSSALLPQFAASAARVFR